MLIVQRYGREDMMSRSTIAKTAGIGKGIEIEEPIHVGPGCVVMAKEIGRYCFINANTCIFDGVKIGRFVTFARNCQIGGVEHPIHYLSTSFFRISKNWFPDDPVHQSFDFIKNTRPKGARENVTNIGSDVWFGASSILLKGVSVGHGSIIGAGAVVTKDVPAYAIVAGNPAKVIRYRFDPKTIDRLLRARWWDLDVEFLSKLPLDDPNKCLSILEAHLRIS